MKITSVRERVHRPFWDALVRTSSLGDSWTPDTPYGRLRLAGKTHVQAVDLLSRPADDPERLAAEAFGVLAAAPVHVP